MKYRPSIGIPLLVTAGVSEFFLGRSGIVFFAALTVVWVWSQSDA